MTLADLKKRAEAWGAVGSAVRPWIPYIAAGVVVAVLCLKWNGTARELATARRQAATADLTAKGLLAERDATIADLRGDLKAAGDQVAAFRKAWEDAKAKAPELVIREVVRWRTAPAPAAPGAAPLPAPAPGAPAVECLYDRASLGALEGVSAKAEGKAGARVVVIGAQFVRTAPGGPTVVWEGSASAPLSEASALPPAPGLGHGFGAVGVAVPGFLGVGPSWSPPPVKWWILKSGEASIGIPVAVAGKNAGSPGVVVNVHARF